VIVAAATRHRRLLWTITIGYWLVLFTLTHLPPSKLPQTHVSDKLEHFTAYGLLAGWLSLSLTSARRSVLKTILLVMAIVLIYAAADELTQPLTHRTCDIHDWFADGIGAATGAVLIGAARLLVPREAQPG
jgi:VanZ family protein